MTIRKEFEAWAKDNKLSLCRNAKKPDEYAFCAQKAWLAWQACAHKPVSVSLDIAVNAMLSLEDHDTDEDKVKAILDAAGVRYVD